MVILYFFGGFSGFMWGGWLGSDCSGCVCVFYI